MKNEIEEFINEFIKDVVEKEHQFMASGSILSDGQRTPAIARIFDTYIEKIGAK